MASTSPPRGAKLPYHGRLGFHAQASRDLNVERLECLPDRDGYARKRSHVAGSDDEHEVERAYGGERSIWP